MNALMRGPLLSQFEADALDMACLRENRKLHAAGMRRHTAVKPSFRLDGPLEPILLMDSQASDHHPLGVGQRYC